MSSQLVDLIQQLTELDSFRMLTELIKNPRQIVMAHDTARREMILTAAEEEKLRQAHEYMADYDEKRAKLEADMELFQERKIKHFSDYQALVDAQEKESERLEALREELDKKEANLNENIAIYIENKNKLDAEKKNRKGQ